MALPGHSPGKVAEPADKPGFVVDSHSSRRIVADTLKQPTRRHRGPRHCLPIWSCSRWGLPCRSVAGLAVRSYRTISPLPRIPKNRSAVSFCCTFRRLAPPRRYLAPCPVEPGLSSAFLRTTRLPGRLRRGHCRTAAALYCNEPRSTHRAGRASTRPRRTPADAQCWQIHHTLNRKARPHLRYARRAAGPERCGKDRRSFVAPVSNTSQGGVADAMPAARISACSTQT